MTSTRQRKFVKWGLGFLLITTVGIQFFNPSLKNPPIQPGHDLMATNPPPVEVAMLLHNACYDCHSYETRWPWYAHVAPVSWWISDHMKDGRRSLNFSEWPRKKPEDATDLLDSIVRTVHRRKMPLPSYTWLGMHPDAKLTDEQRGRIEKWAEQEAQRLSNAE